MVIINGNFSYPTRLAKSYIPDPLFRVYVGSIHKAKVRCLTNLSTFHSLLIDCSCDLLALTFPSARL
jgi:hypothetical protein